MGPILRSAALVLVTVSVTGVQEAPESITAEDIRGHLFLLSSDRLEGRAPGSRGAAVAAEYIASRFIASGLEPLGGDYHQDVPLTGVTVDPTSLSLAFESEDARLPATYPGDAVIWPGTGRSATQVSGEVVFVGYGIDAPAWSWDDFEDRDLNGKVLLFLVGDPPAPPDEPELFNGRGLTYYGRWTYKLEEARRRGAIGALIVHRSEAAGYDWGVIESSWTGEQLRLEDRGDDPALPLSGWLTEDFARRVLRLAGLDLDELTVRAARRDFRPVSTGMTVRSRMNSRSRSIEATNVVGFLPGRTDDVVVYTAHYDHLGIGAPVDGDSIYNGAYDNGSGVSVLLEIADAFTRTERPRRGIVFIATSAEEAGLLGARHYIREPLVPLENTVAALNIDGANLWGETDDVIALGAERSTLQGFVERRAAELGLTARPDPVPERGSYFRSDHFAFARAGVPSIHLQHGLRFRGRPDGWGDSVMAGWLREHYHRPSDEFDPTADLAGAVQQARLLYWIGSDLANAETAPAWRGTVTFPVTNGAGGTR